MRNSLQWTSYLRNSCVRIHYGEGDLIRLCWIGTGTVSLRHHLVRTKPTTTSGNSWSRNTQPRPAVACIFEALRIVARNVARSPGLLSRLFFLRARCDSAVGRESPVRGSTCRHCGGIDVGPRKEGRPRKRPPKKGALTCTGKVSPHQPTKVPAGPQSVPLHQ